MGYLADNVPSTNGLLAQILIDNGAIIIVKGNCPQALMMANSYSFWGNSANPYDSKRQTAGSSGGDAGLVAARCVPFSVGADIGGSLRYPAHFCGIFTFKPTQ
jgi:Asp-tRNA(Asn)/Glu-tRNA(Gln) amidotransferase A subunit family amidase